MKVAEKRIFLLDGFNFKPEESNFNEIVELNLEGFGYKDIAKMTNSHEVDVFIALIHRAVVDGEFVGPLEGRNDYTMQTFEIPGALPNMNKIIAASKKHHMQYSNMKKDFTALVQIHAMNLEKVESADFEIVWYCIDKRQDKDNIMAGQKFIFDGLVKAGVLKNDGWKQIGDVSHRFVIDKENPRIQVNIKEFI